MSKNTEKPRFKNDEAYNFELANETKDPVKKLRVFIATIAANISAIAVGTCMSWTSPVGPKLKLEDTSDSPLSHPIDKNADAWIGSILAIGAAITPFIAGPLADKIGRKRALLCSAIFFILAYVLMLFATEVWIMLIARTIKGFGIGFVMSVVPMYVGEIATDDTRGSLGSLMSFFIGVGVFYVLCIGPFVSYFALQYFCLAIPIIFVIVFVFMPESPYFYIAQGHRNKALKSLKFLRGQSTETVEKELNAIETMVKTSMAEKGSILDLVKIAANRKAIIICFGLITFQQISGINAVLFNSQSIFDTANIGLNGAIASIIVTAIQLITAGIAPLIADRFNRKTILIVSAFFMAVGLAALGFFFFFKLEMGYSINWLPIPSLLLYLVMFILGYGPLPWTVLSEMFAPNVKPIASSLVASQCWIAGFFVALVYPTLHALGAYYAFWIFSLCCVLAFFFSWFVVMETRGLSLQEIQNRLHEK